MTSIAAILETVLFQKPQTMTPEQVEDHIRPLNINGMQGRVLQVSAKTKGQREILLLYGHHALLERWWGLVENLNEYGSVTMPDLPGLGGMDSFYKIGRKPTLDDYADYLAAFMTLRYRRRRLTIVGISFGFLVATRMLQKYPEFVKKVDLVASLVGFMHKDDFIMSAQKRRLLSKLSKVLTIRPIPSLIRYGVLTDWGVRNMYMRTKAAKLRFSEVGPERFEKLLKFETKLWQVNDVRTHWFTTSEFLEVDNCQATVKLPVFHVVSSKDQYFDNALVEQHMRIVYDEYMQGMMKSVSHTPSVLGNKKELSVMLPIGLRELLDFKKD